MAEFGEKVGIVSGLSEMWGGAQDLMAGKEGAGWELGMGAFDTAAGLAKVPMLDAAGGIASIVHGVYDMSEGSASGDTSRVDSGIGEGLFGAAHTGLGMVEDSIAGAMAAGAGADAFTLGALSPFVLPGELGGLGAEAVVGGVDTALSVAQLAGDWLGPQLGIGESNEALGGMVQG